MKNNLLIPSNFNAAELINKELPNFKSKKGITIDNLNYICNCIIKSSK